MKFTSILAGSVGVAAAGIFGFLWRIRFLNDANILRRRNPGGHILYVDWQGDYSKLQPLWAQLFPKIEEISKQYPGTECMGIYYDSSQVVADRNLLRGCVGGILPPEVPSEKAQELSQKLGLKYKYVPAADSCYVRFPHLGILSLGLWNFKAYPALRKYLLENKLVPDKASTFTAVSVDYYYWDERYKEKESEISYLFGQGADQWAFSIHPQPSWKADWEKDSK